MSSPDINRLPSLVMSLNFCTKEKQELRNHFGICLLYLQQVTWRHGGWCLGGYGGGNWLERAIRTQLLKGLAIGLNRSLCNRILPIYQIGSTFILFSFL